MIGLALLVHPHELWVSVSGVYRDLSPENFELTADHRKQKNPICRKNRSFEMVL